MRKVASFKERMDMAAVMQENSQELDGDPLQRRWNPNWSFNAAAKAVNKAFVDHHARYVAEQMGWKFEDLPTGPKMPTPSVVANKVDQLDKQFAAFEDRVNNVIRKCERLLTIESDIPEALRIIKSVTERIDGIEARLLEVLRSDANSNRGDGKALRKATALEQRLGRVENWAREQGFKH